MPVEMRSIDEMVHRKELEVPQNHRRVHEICEIQTRDIVCSGWALA